MRKPTPFIWISSLLAILVLTPYGFIRHHFFNHRLRDAARSRPCPSCGHTLGTAALHAADGYWRARSSEHHDDPVFSVIRRRIYALCPGCGVGLGFREESSAFEPIEATKRLQ